MQIFLLKIEIEGLNQYLGLILIFLLQFVLFFIILGLGLEKVGKGERE